MILAVLMMIGGGASAQVSFGEPEKVNAEWKFNLGDVAGGSAADFDASRWRTVELPHDWSVEAPLSPSLASATGYLPGGIGWYRKTLDIPADRQGEKVYLYFEGVYNRSEVFVNGVSVGKRPNGYVSFMYDITPHVKYGAGNLVAVRVDHSQSADSRWYTGSGIYRDVWVVYAPQVHIAQWGVFAWPEVKGTRGTLNVEVEIENGSAASENLTVVSELFDAAGARVASKSAKVTASAGANAKANLALAVSKPRIWSLDNPALYRLETRVMKGSQVIDRTTTTTGFRTFTFDPNKGFALNGEWMKMKGVCLHHDAGVLGAAVPREVWKRRLETLKNMGVNAIRTSHNPASTDLYELCDEIGLLVLNEMYDEWMFPKRKWLVGWNVGTPGFEGSYDIFKEWGEKDLADFVRRDRNHISVFAWSIGNEVDYPNDPYSHPVLGGDRAPGFTQATYGGYNPDAPDAMQLGEIAERLVKAVKEYDRSRPATAALAGVAMSNQTGYPGALDIQGYNYTESMYDADHAAYPDRVLYGSENRHDMAAWKAVRDKEFIFGQFLWTGIDYLGEAGRWPARGSSAGLLNLAGLVKPRGEFRRALWSSEQVAYLGTYPAPTGQRAARMGLSQDAWPVWNYEPGQQIRVVCYTNAPQARLLVNGREVGAAKNYDDNTGIISWDVPYEAGTLEVVGMDAAGGRVSGYSIRTSGRPHALKITENVSGEGLSQMVLQVVDSNGIPVMLADNEITCTVEGPAKLLGLEAGNGSDTGNYTDNRQRVFMGKLLAYIQATGEPGEATIRFSSPWLAPVEVKIAAK
jgi:hypothetical protein